MKTLLTNLIAQLPEGFYDDTYQNDVVERLAFDLDDGDTYSVIIERPDYIRKHFPKRNPVDTYVVTRYVDSDDEEVELYTTEDEEKLIKFVEKDLKKYQPA